MGLNSPEDQPSSRAPQVFSIHHNEGHDPTPGFAVTLVDTAFSLWDDFTDEQIFLATTSDPPALFRSVPAGPQVSFETSDRKVSYSDSTWAQHEKWTDNGPFCSDVERTCIPLSSWHRPTNVDVFQTHDPWRSQHWQTIPHPSTLRVQRQATSGTETSSGASTPTAPLLCMAVLKKVFWIKTRYGSGT